MCGYLLYISGYIYNVLLCVVSLFLWKKLSLYLTGHWENYISAHIYIYIVKNHNADVNSNIIIILLVWIQNFAYSEKPVNKKKTTNKQTTSSYSMQNYAD